MAPRPLRPGDRLTERVRRTLAEERETVDPAEAPETSPPEPGELSEETVREGLERLESRRRDD